MKLSKLRVPDLRKELKARGLDEKGIRPVLIRRLREAVQREQNAENEQSTQADPQTANGDQPTSVGQNLAYSDTQQQAASEKCSAEVPPKAMREYKHEDKIEARDPSPKRPYALNGRDGEPYSANKDTGKILPHMRPQYASETIGRPATEKDKTEASPASPAQDLSPKKPQTTDKGATSTSPSPPDQKNGIKVLENDGTGAPIEQPNMTASPSKNDKPTETKSSGNINSGDDVASVDRIRRRKKRFGIVMKEAANGDPTDDQAVQRRRARFGIKALVNSSSKTSKQDRDQIALRRRAEKFGLGGKKRATVDTSLSKEEIEKRLKRQKRFQSVS
ncbi:unnamed protein product [Agarophyton chilense]|eukprot:gb/GEZJ01000330.1/.p1 GENE.gb/GEZJ01000330.1/~~gb/GEZJ01000330.1/.p1  ORF type:complete len:333 (-),score=59.88 gb/GEZJ01000330.1/:1109-2107(-)